MKKNSNVNEKNANKINKVEVTGDVITSRGGLILFVRYLNAIGILSRMESLFGVLRKSRKGQPISEIFKQLFCFFLDGTSRHLVYFDSLAKDEGYARGIETEPSDMLSSHAVKRFFHSAALPLSWLFRRIMLELFVWRLRIAKPDVIELGLDSMVMDNDEAQKREGAKPTYKKVKGFQPLQMTWGRFIIDAVFRSGDRHCNHGNDTIRMIKRVVNQIYRCYRTDVAVVVRIDSGFFDQKVFEFCEKEHIGYICGGKMYGGIKTIVENIDRSNWGRYENGVQVWEFVEFSDRRSSWSRSRRAFYCRPLCQDRQMVFAFARPDTVIYTNIGTDDVLDAKLRQSQGSYMLEGQGIIKAYHDRGADELVHRALKDFGFEELPFLRFHQNAALYYTMLIGFMLFESFKVDVCIPVIPVSAYATTVRRKLIDIAAKVVRHAGDVVLKISSAVFDRLKFDVLWEKSAMPPAAV
jgi:hypothetical protein